MQAFFEEPQQSLPFRRTIVLSLANDSDFYIPTRRAFEEGSYEVTTCPLKLELLHELKTPPP